MADDTDDWGERLREIRAEKDDFFATDRQSPLSADAREAFDGLSYFEPNPAYRVDATVSVAESSASTDLETSDGRTVRYERVLTFEFTLDGETRTLAGFRPPDESDQTILVPFRDKTTGQATYRDGRYLELESEGQLQTGDHVTLDFNLAYTPFCAFNDAFSCPLPPEENWLETTVEAGEQTPPVSTA